MMFGGGRWDVTEYKGRGREAGLKRSDKAGCMRLAGAVAGYLGHAVRLGKNVPSVKGAGRGGVGV